MRPMHKINKITMRSIILIIALVAGFNVNATSNIDATTLNQILSKKVQTGLSMPQALKQECKTQKITIYFSVDDCGDVVEVNAKTTNKAAKADIEKQFLKLNFKGLKPCVYNSIDVSFIIV